MRTNKYNAQRTELNGTVYDSKFESRVAQRLAEIYPERYILTQMPVRLITSQNKFLTISMVLDFMIKYPNREYPIFVEAKGMVTPEWLLKYKLLWNLKPYIAARTLVVFDDNHYQEGKKKLHNLDQVIKFSDLRKEII